MTQYYPHKNVMQGARRPAESKIGPWFCITKTIEDDAYGEFLEAHRSRVRPAVVIRISEYHGGAVKLGPCVVLDVGRATQIRDRLSALIVQLEEPEEAGTARGAAYQGVQFIKEQCGRTGVVRSRCYASTFGYLQKLIELAKEDFPFLKDEDFEVKRYGGIHYKSTFGVEFTIPETVEIPDTYRTIHELEQTL